MVEHTQTHSPAFFSLWIYLSDNFQREVPKEISRRKVGFSFWAMNRSTSVSRVWKPRNKIQLLNLLRLQNDDNISINW